MRTTAGRAHYEAMRIELNPGLINLPGIDGHAEVDRTLRHELAHLVAYLRAGGRRIDPHGAEWRRACSDLGIPGESRCHSLPFAARQIERKYLYLCPACGVEVPRVRKFRRPVACYSCCRKHSGGRYDDRFRLKAVNQKSR
jgi:predicted SprT family Zn-dependent metalloprotease